MCFVSNSSTMIINLRTTHCCSSGGSRSAAAGKGRRGRGGEATEDGFGRAGGDTSGVAASLTASVSLALAGSKTRQRRTYGYRSAHEGAASSLRQQGREEGHRQCRVSRLLEEKIDEGNFRGKKA